jgi:hypothetical protein
MIAREHGNHDAYRARAEARAGRTGMMRRAGIAQRKRGTNGRQGQGGGRSGGHDVKLRKLLSLVLRHKGGTLSMLHGRSHTIQH